MLLLHGEYGTSRWWELFFSVLPTEIRAYAPDLRGTGRSEKPDGGYTIAEQAEDLNSFIEALSLKEIDLVAHSASGAIAIEFALHNPRVLNSLVLVNSVPIEGVHSPPDTLLLLSQMQTDRRLLEESLALLVSSICGERFSDSELSLASFDYAKNILFPQMVHDASQMAAPLFTAAAKSLNNWNRLVEAGSLTLPTLLIWGDQDPLVSQSATTRTLIAIPGAANLEILRGIGHCPMIECPLRLAELIINFITDDHGDYDEIRDSI